MSLLDNMPHTASAYRRVRSTDDLGGADDAYSILTFDSRECWLQPASDNEVRTFQKRGIDVNGKVFFTSDPGLDTRHAVTVNDADGNSLGTWLVKSRPLPDTSVGLGVLYKVMVEQSTTGSIPDSVLGEGEEDISDALTNAENIAANTAAIESNDVDIAANASNISGNDTDIATNAAGVAANAVDITALENAELAVSVLNHGGNGNGTTDNVAAIAAAIAAVPTGGWLVFLSGTFLIESDVTFTVPVLFAGGILRLDTGVTATFNEPYMNPGMGKCFDEQGRLPNAVGGIVIALTNPQTVVSPLDWGADNSGTSDSYLDIQHAIDAVTYAASADKTGVVEFISGEYLATQGVFVGYDFKTYDDWVAKAFICKANHANTSSRRRQRVILRGLGKATIKGSGAAPSATNPYLLYYAASGEGSGHTIIENMSLDSNSWQWRGAYVSHMAYNDSIDGLTLVRSKEVGLDWIDCWGSKISSILGIGCNGHVVRTWRCNSVIGDTLKIAGYGMRDDHWPDPTETFIVDIDGNDVQTPVADRANAYLGGNVALWQNVVVETVANGSPMAVTVAANKVTCSQQNHGLAATDPIWFPDSATPATTVASATVSTFVASHEGVAGTLKKVYRRATAITAAEPLVVTCQNHGMATGQRVKIIAGDSGMSELVDNGPWYVMTRLTDDTFSLQDFYGVDVDATGYTVGDGSDYIVSGPPGIYFDGDESLLLVIRFEGNRLPYAKVVVADGVTAATIEGMTVADYSRSPSDWFIEMRGNVNGSRVSGIKGNVDRAAVLFRCDDSDNSHGNRIDCLTYGDDQPSLGNVEFNVEGTAAQQLAAVQGNWICGRWTPIVAVSSDTTPSVLGAEGGNSYLGFHGTRVYGPTLRIPDANFSLTDFDDGYDGQVLTVLFLGANVTVVHNVATIVTNTGANVSPVAGECMQFVNNGGVWRQLSGAT